MSGPPNSNVVSFGGPSSSYDAGISNDQHMHDQPGIYTHTETVTTTIPGNNFLTERSKTEEVWKRMWKNSTISSRVGTIMNLGYLETFSAFMYYFVLNMAVANNLGVGAISMLAGMFRFVTFACFTREGAGHVDPAYSVGMTVIGRLGPFWWPFVFLYITCQIVGACLASGFVMAFFPGNEKSYGLGTIGPDMPGYTPGQSMGLEIVLCACYYFILFYLVNSNFEINLVEVCMREKKVSYYPIVAGLLHTGFVWTSTTISGGNLNWFRIFWGQAISGTLDSNWWVSIFGPAMGLMMGLCLLGFQMYVSDISYHKIQIRKPPLVKEGFQKQD